MNVNIQVKPDASEAELKKAYRKLAMKSVVEEDTASSSSQSSSHFLMMFMNPLFILPGIFENSCQFKNLWDKTIAAKVRRNI